MAYYRCTVGAGGGGSGELHGATIVVTCDDDLSIGVTCTLNFGDETIGSQVFTSTKTLVFEDILGVGTYTASIMLDKEFTGEILVTAEDVVNKNTVDGLITTIFYLYNEGDECTDITGGWEKVGSGTNTAVKETNRMKIIYGELGTVKLIDVTKYNTLKIVGTQAGTSGATFYISESLSNREQSSGNYIGNKTGDFTSTTNISSMTNLCITLSQQNPNWAACYVTKVWLE